MILLTYRRFTFVGRCLYVASIIMTVCATGTAIAQRPDKVYTKVLLPIVLANPTPGAAGSLWATEFAVSNSASVGVDVYPLFSTSFCDACTNGGVPANSTYFPLPITDRNGVRGTFLFIDRDHLHDVEVVLRVRDISRSNDSWGTRLPVVQEDDFVARTTTIANIPTSDQFRQTLRIYGLDGLDQTPVRIQLYGTRNDPDSSATTASSDVLLGEIAAMLNIDPSAAADIYKTRPAFFEWGSFMSLGPSTTYKRVRVDVTPLTEGKRTWAFVSVTNNSSQQVTILEPISVR